MKTDMLIPLLGTAAAAAAVASLVYNKVKRDNISEEQYKQIRDYILEEQYRQIRDAASRLLATSKRPVTVLVLGFQNHGLSSFVNTMFRVLYKEEGPLVMRAKKNNNTNKPRVLRMRNTLMRSPKYFMNVIDAPCLSTSGDIDEKTIRSVLRGRLDAGTQVSELGDGSKPRKVYPVPECVILVMKAGGSYMGGPASDLLPQIARIIRQEGLNLVVVLTHKKEAQKASIDLRVLTRGVALEAETDFVHCIENYVVDRRDDKSASIVSSNDFDTRSQTLSILRECFEYVEQHRQVKPDKISEGRGALDDEASYDSASD